MSQATVRIPAPLLAFTRGVRELSIRGTTVGDVVFIVLAVAFAFALAVLGRGRLTWPVLLTALWFEVAFLAMLVLRGQVLDAPWLGGLPLTLGTASLLAFLSWLSARRLHASAPAEAPQG